jgi:hypothetical protein
MLQRCFNPNHKEYPNYGGRDVTVYERWLTFEGFYADVGDPPPGMSIHRINNDGDYEPGNVQWATKSVQNSNRRRSSKAKVTQNLRGKPQIARSQPPLDCEDVPW